LRQTVALRNLGDARGERLQVERPGKRERDVLDHGDRLEQREVLEHHGDAQGARFARVVDARRQPVPFDAAGIGAHRAVDDLHQRALAGTVLAQDSMDLARRNRKVDSVQCDDCGVGLANVSQRQEW